MSKTFASNSTYPLAWPENFPRTKRPESSRFKTSLFQALENVQDSLKKFGADSGKKLTNVVISSNYSLTETKPSDSGVVVYFDWDEEQVCIPVDRYSLVEDNLQAIYHCIEAKRTMLRHGGINLVKAAFRGYAALPHFPEGEKLNDEFVELFGLKYEEITKLSHPQQLNIYRTARSKFHPDKETGDANKFHRVNILWDQISAHPMKNKK